MNKIPNYIFNYILETILKYKYYSAKNLKNLNSKDYHNGRNLETINYSLVSKKWGEIISSLLNKYFSLKNNEVLSYFLLNSNYNKNCYIVNNCTTATTKNNCNNNFKLIKEYPLTIFNSIEKYKHFLINSSNIQCKRVVNLNEFEIDDLKDFLKENNTNYINNVEFNIRISIDEFKGEKLKFVKEFNCDINIELNGALYDQVFNNGILITKPALKKYLKLKPKKIHLKPNDKYCQDSYIHMNYTPLFENNSTVEEIHVSYTDHVDPCSIAKINNKVTKLKKLSCSFLFHDILKGLNKQNQDSSNVTNSNSNIECLKNECDCDYGGLRIENSIQHDWEAMIYTLKTNSTIKDLSLKNFCHKNNCYENLDTSKLTKGLKEVFTSPLSSIETLELQTIDFMDSVLLSALQENQTIKNLILMNINEALIFKKVLPVNRIIRNVYLNCINSMDDLLSLLLNSQELNLYSISVKFKRFEDNDIIKFKTNYKNYNNNIKEFNFYSSNNRKFKTILYNS
ncbi:hypothetical protein DICPUDRAFT_77192 [Dictyostelium purpureum]|uniref:Uncharacterized protein n=1 Tax=Dictyostelium purpureum TaxID=5786 RepID=F0ZFW0_DICPU|nr:uncharacterized protein DICPUDRAFT_77192 [Dictyostelium purpureum]EGC37163.1 hypothetical protein DICPUDRAFT_77192 [Dictyostelium purpureum]|eukprot:XP_003286291.1 hypothetical protein DICPUDRAFT_77192 [Dictyostelium purpureum]